MDDKRAGRIHSLKLPRDLTLGLGRSKKQYTPNLNVVRNKDKPKEMLKKMDQRRKEKTTNRMKNDKIDSRYVQSTGVFSQGAGETKRLGMHMEKSVSWKERSTVAPPTVNKNSWSVNKKAEDAVLDDLMNCDNDSDDEKMSFEPLTLSDNTKVKKEVNVKKEEGELNSVVMEPFSGEYSEENPALALVKLPDSFAGKGLSDDPNVKKLFDYPLCDMLEGQIGKLVIRKSGKVEVQIGRIIYDLSADNSYESKEELVSITQGQNGENIIAKLGAVTNNFIMFPDYEFLIKKKR